MWKRKIVHKDHSGSIRLFTEWPADKYNIHISQILHTYLTKTKKNPIIYQIYYYSNMGHGTEYVLYKQRFSDLNLSKYYTGVESARGSL